MADRRIARQAIDDFPPGEGVADQAEPPFRMKPLAVEGDDSGSLLAAVPVVTPSPDRDVRAPFAVKVNFRPHGGSKIDASRVKIIYLKRPAVDLTARLRAAISEAGIDLADATAPPGTHDIKIDVTDDAGRTKSAVVSFTVVK